MICVFPEKRSDGKSSFRDAVEYAIYGKHSKRVDPDERVLYSGTKNISSSQFDEFGNYNLRAIYEEMFLTALHKKSQAGDPVVHCILSWREGEEPTREQYEEAVEIWAQEQGLSECQIFWSVHKDTDNYHLDVVANRIDPVSFYAAPMHFRFKANERAARKIEIAQGWALEKSGHLAHVEELKNIRGEVIGHHVAEHGKKMSPEEKAKTERSISKRARDSEVRTGEKSAERIAKEVAAPIILAAKSWAEVHAKLAEKGIRLEKKGSGGILYIGDQPVKLSVAGRQCAFSKIVSRLGDFQSRDLVVVIKKFVPEITERAKDSGRAGKIREYNDMKCAYYEKKREANAALWSEITKVRADFRAQKKERRAALFAEKRQNPDFDLKAQLSQMAMMMAVQAARIAEEIEKKKKKHKELFGGRWPSYVQWLRNQELYREAEFWRYQFTAAIIFGDTADYQQYQFARYTPEVAGKVVRYRGQDGRIKFVDKGNLISVFDSENRDTVWDCLRMAQQKFGKIAVRGTEEFKTLCVDLIAEHAEYFIEFRDPELQQRVAERRREIAEAQERERQKQRQQEAYEKLSAFMQEYNLSLGQAIFDSRLSKRIFRYVRPVLEKSSPNLERAEKDRVFQVCGRDEDMKTWYIVVQNEQGKYFRLRDDEFVLNEDYVFMNVGEVGIIKAFTGGQGEKFLISMPRIIEERKHGLDASQRNSGRKLPSGKGGGYGDW